MPLLHPFRSSARMLLLGEAILNLLAFWFKARSIGLLGEREAGLDFFYAGQGGRSTP